MKLISLAIAGVIGLCLGICEAYTINLVLIQVSINPLVNVYYGCLFLMLGSYLFIRINQKSKIALEITVKAKKEE